MINSQTIKELRQMRLPGMARELESQLEAPQSYKDLDFESRFALLVEAERVSRKENTIHRRIKDAKLTDSGACIEAIEYHEDRHLNRSLITQLSTCAFIQENHHVIIKGATGSGKTFLGCAIGNCACRKQYKVRYVRLPDLLNEASVAKGTGEWAKIKAAYAKYDLLIIDEWLLRPIPEAESYELFEFIDACSAKGALVICTQYDTDEWYYRIDCDRPEDEDSTVAEAVLDRLIHNKYTINIDGSISMRKRRAFAQKEESGVDGNV